MINEEKQKELIVFFLYGIGGLIYVARRKV